METTSDADMAGRAFDDGDDENNVAPGDETTLMDATTSMTDTSMTDAFATTSDTFGMSGVSESFEAASNDAADTMGAATNASDSFAVADDELFGDRNAFGDMAADDDMTVVVTEVEIPVEVPVLVVEVPVLVDVVEPVFVPAPFHTVLPPVIPPATPTLKKRVASVGAGAFELIRENPVPAALTALGLSSLVLSARGKKQHYRPSVPRRRPGQVVTGVMNAAGETVSSAVETAKDAAGTVAETAANVASGAASTTKNVASTVAGAAAGTASTVADGAKTGASTVARLAGQGGAALWGTCRANPVPAAASALSLFWLVQSQRKGGDGLDKVANLARSVKDAAERAEDKLDDTGDRVEDRAEVLADGAKETIRGAAQAVAGKTTQTVGAVGRVLRDSPLALVATALAVGATIGLALPETAVEERLLGETGGRLAEKAQQAVQTVADNVADKVQNVADKVEKVADNAERALQG